MWWSRYGVGVDLSPGGPAVVWWSTYGMVVHVSCGGPPVMWWSSCGVGVNLSPGGPAVVWESTYGMVVHLLYGGPAVVWESTYRVVVQLWCGGPARAPRSASAVTYLSPQGLGGGLLQLNSLLPAREMQSELHGCHEPGQADSSHLIPQRANRAQGKALKFHRDLFLKHYNQVERFQLSH